MNENEDCNVIEKNISKDVSYVDPPIVVQPTHVGHDSNTREYTVCQEAFT